MYTQNNLDYAERCPEGVPAKLGASWIFVFLIATLVSIGCVMQPTVKTVTSKGQIAAENDIRNSKLAIIAHGYLEDRFETYQSLLKSKGDIEVRYEALYSADADIREFTNEYNKTMHEHIAKVYGEGFLTELEFEALKTRENG